MPISILSYRLLAVNEVLRLLVFFFFFSTFGASTSWMSLKENGCKHVMHLTFCLPTRNASESISFFEASDSLCVQSLTLPLAFLAY